MHKGTWNVISTDGNPDSGVTVETVNGYGHKVNLRYYGNVDIWTRGTDNDWATPILGTVYLPIAWREIENA